VTIASDAVLACYAAWSGSDTAAELARVVRQAAAPRSEAALFEQMWRSRHAASVRALKVIGQAHPGISELAEHRLIGKTGFFGGAACSLPPIPGADLPDDLQRRLPVHRVDRASNAAGRSTRA
jgi:hypothetical protein